MTLILGYHISQHRAPSYCGDARNAQITGIVARAQSGGRRAVSTPDITLTPFFSGIALDVTPRISRDNEVILHIRPAVTEVVDRRKEIVVAGSDQSLRSGQIIVIGGLMQDSVSSQVAKTPVPGDIPGLGRLFRHDRQVASKTELVILLRPVVVDRDEVSDYAVGEVGRGGGGGWPPAARFAAGWARRSFACSWPTRTS